uniref:(California timema) hypothetical protein n=1 Tax=Timema californicum TaxID=61474 RepID=A0A7R9JAU5_TIMCA|nr:unnamed protein product [Timema californicum]
MKVFVALALFALAYATAEATVLTDEQISALTQEEAVAITDEEWINIFTPRCTPTSTYYWSSQYLSDIRDCHYFYECVGFKPVRMECAANLHWNSKETRIVLKERLLGLHFIRFSQGRTPVLVIFHTPQILWFTPIPPLPEKNHPGALNIGTSNVTILVTQNKRYQLIFSEYNRNETMIVCVAAEHVRLPR